MANLDLVNFEDLYINSLRRVKGDPEDSESLQKIKEILNTRYRQICKRKKWKFLRTDRSFRLLKKYTTGTVSFTSGLRTITGTGTAWDTSHEGSWIILNGSNISYRIVSVISSTQIIVASENSENTFTLTQYRIYKAEVALWPNLDDIDDIRIDGNVKKCEPIGPAMINQMRQRFPGREGKPRYYTIEGKKKYSGLVLGAFLLGYDFLGSTLQKSISFFPAIQEKDYTVQVYYKLRVTAMVAPTDEPLIPIEYRALLMYYALSDWYASNDSQMAAYYQKLGDSEFQEMMAHYLDTDDTIMFRPRSTITRSSAWLSTHSSYYFDTSD